MHSKEINARRRRLCVNILCLDVRRRQMYLHFRDRDNVLPFGSSHGGHCASLISHKCIICTHIKYKLESGRRARAREEGERSRVKVDLKPILDPGRIFSRGSVRDLALNVHEFIQESSYT